MAAGENQKLKMLYLCRMFAKKTDESHGMTVAEIIEYLGENGISANRKTLYSDIAGLRSMGLDIESRQQGKTVIYYLESRMFRLSDLKIIVDALQATRFITAKKAGSLVGRLENLASDYGAEQLHRAVYTSGQIRTMNESIFYNVDKIYSAINSDSQIRFHHLQWNAKKEIELADDGSLCCISPWYLVWDNKYYYLIGHEAATDMIRHYRVDKMLHITKTDVKREGAAKIRDIDVGVYSRHAFGLFDRDRTRITLEAENSRAGVIIDHFGRDTVMKMKDEDHFTATVNVIVSDYLLGWIIGLGPGIKVISPDSVIERMKAIARRISDQYLVQE